MHLLVYTSQSLIEPAVAEFELDQIVADSKRNNTANGLTGVMFQHRDRFIQLLEGEQSAIRQTFERIQKDPRHTQIEILFDSAIRQRGCPDWSMGAFDIPENVDISSQHLKALSDGYRKNFIVQTDTILSLLRGFVSEPMDLSSL
ncbi:MAG: BLUF domain-containing protein [Fuerstiella sp.]